MANVLVTGGGGFLGRYVVEELLNESHYVSILGRSRQDDLLEKGVTVHQMDLAEPKDLARVCENVDVIFHVAAKAGFWGDYDDYYASNVVATELLLSTARQAGVKDFVYTSTPSVVFTGEPFTGQGEELSYGKNWLCAYAQTKAIAEEKVLLANSPSFRTTALRPHLIWGKGDNHLIPRVIAKAKTGRLRIVGNGDNLVDITHVSDAARAHLQAWKALSTGGTGGRAYFLSQGEPVNLWDWINNLLERLEIRPIHKKISLSAAYRLGHCFETVYEFFHLQGEPPMTRFVATELAKSHYFSIENAKKDFGYEPRVCMEEGLNELVDSLR